MIESLGFFGLGIVALFALIAVVFVTLETWRREDDCVKKFMMTLFNVLLFGPVLATMVYLMLFRGFFEWMKP